MTRLPVSEHTLIQWAGSYIELQNDILEEVLNGNISKDSYLLDYIYDFDDNESVINQLEEDN